MADRELALSQDELRLVRQMIDAYRESQARGRFLGAAFGRTRAVVIAVAAAVTIASSIMSVYYSAHSHNTVVIEKVSKP